MYRSLALFFGFLILFNSTKASINQGKGDSVGSGNGEEQRCTFRGKQYAPGEVWQANASIPHCVLCSCLQSGKMNCTRLDCCDDDEDGNRSQSNRNANNMSIQSETSSTGGLVLTRRIREGKMTVCCESCSGSDGGGGGGGRLGGGKGNERSSSVVRSSTIQTISHYEKDSSSHYDDEETDDDPLVQANLEHVSCLHQGKIYRDGEVFAANMSGLPISDRGRDHCMHCVCQGGMVLCTMKPCSVFDCTKNKSTSGVIEACCEKCHADRENVNTNSGMAQESGPKLKSAERSARGGLRDMNDIADAQYLYTSISNTDEQNTGGAGSSSGSSNSQESSRHFIVNHRLVPSTNNKKSGCISAGKFHFHGSTWHPVIGSFGSMECVVCKCLNSRIECSRLPCPSARELQCYTLVKLEGSCCPTCTLRPPFESGDRQLCVPMSQDVTVYKAHEYSGSNDTEVLRISFVRPKGTVNPKFQVEIHEWTLTGGKIARFFTTYFTIEDFLKAQRKRTSIMLGATSTRNLEKFTKREKKLHFRCKFSCNTRIQSLQLTLRLHELVAKPKCSFVERNVLL